MNNYIKFAHLADLHLGSYREKTLTKLNFYTFQKAIEKVIEEKVDFCIFAGDIFNNALPPIELVQQVVTELKKLKDNNIPLYVIGGSHDYSNTGKSFIELLDTTGILIDIGKYEYVDKDRVNLKFHKDKSGAVISGILGRKNGLDKNIYVNLEEKNPLSDNNCNIFVFHTTLDDIKPNFLKAVKSEVSSRYLPKGFDYYAAGHVHTHINTKFDNGILSYPGPLFPNNFSELIRERPSFNICIFDKLKREIKIKREFLETYQKEHIKIDINNLNALKAREIIENKLETINVREKLILLEVSGIIEGKISDIKINEIVSNLYEKGVMHVLKNTYKLTTSKLEEVEIESNENIETIENTIIGKVLEKEENRVKYENLIKGLFKLELTKQEGEKNAQHEQRIIDAFEKVLNK